MLNVFSGYSYNFKIIINELFEEVMCLFIEMGSDLDYSGVYATVFPYHIQENEVLIQQEIKKLNRHIVDQYYHDLTSLDEYILYGVLNFAHDASEDGFILSDIIDKRLKEMDIKDEEEIDILKNIEDASDLISFFFDDVDFLTVPSFIEMYTYNPTLLDRMGVNLDFYTDIMPPDILKKYELIKELRTKKITETSIINSKEDFFEAVKRSIYAFNTDITQNKLHEVLKGPTGTASEKIVQRLYFTIAQRELKDLDILIHQEVDINRGVVDFNLSIGVKYQALIEFKLGDNNQKESGIKYQLPLYMIKEDIDFGIFVLICYTDEIYNEAEKFYKIAEIESEKYNKNILFLRINASGNYKTASKIKCDKEMGLEDWRYFP